MADLLAIIDQEHQQQKDPLSTDGQLNINVDSDEHFELDFDDMMVVTHSEKKKSLELKKSYQNAESDKQDVLEINFPELTTPKSNLNLAPSIKTAPKQEDNSDSDFDSEDDSVKSSDDNPKKEIETKAKPDFKKFLISKDQSRKKNYIGDDIIAEKNEGEETDIVEETDKQINPKNQTSSSYQAKFSKITQIYDDSTKEYKQQQKEMGIKKLEENIINTAKKERKKVEESKLKFRQSAMGGVITNQLVNVAERFKQQQKQKEELKLEVDKTLVEQSKNMPSIQIEDEGNSRTKSKKKKKKKKKSAKISIPSSSDEEEEKAPIQEQPPKLELKIVHQNLKKQEFQSVLLEEPEEKIDWEALTQQNGKSKNIKHQAIDEEEEKQDIERRKIMINYDDIMRYFLKQDFIKQIEDIQEVKEIRQQGFFQRIASCFSHPKLNSEELQYQRDIIFVISRIKFETQIAEHEILIKSIYKRITLAAQCKQIGNHWVEIGFQGSNPSTDIRGTGLLGLVHIMFFLDNFEECLIYIHKYSIQPKYEFPLVVKMFEYTILCLSLLREGKLFPLCNESQNVFETVSMVYSCLFLKFMLNYIEGMHNITHMNDLNVQLEKNARSNIKTTIRDYYNKIDSKSALKLVQDAVKRSKDLYQNTIKKLADTAPQFQVQQSKFVPSARQKQMQNSTDQTRKKQYSQTNNEEEKPQKLKSQSEKKQQSEFSNF